MPIKSISLKNYKCFSNKKVIEFSTPNTKNPGSGLNIFVGENNSGKTAVLSAFTKLTDLAKLYGEERYEEKDTELIFVSDKDEEQIIQNISGSINIDKDVKTLGFPITFDKIHYIKDNKIWTSTFSGNGISASSYRGRAPIIREEIDSQLAQGLSDLESNKEKKEEFDSNLKKIISSFSKWTIGGSLKRGSHIRYEMLNQRSEDIDYSLGSGILNLFRILYALIVDNSADIIIIDEPESFLHPKAQQILSKLLLEKSKDNQIIIATHSPYMFKEILDKSKLFIFERKKNKINIQTITKQEGLFKKISPTFSEINYTAYGLISSEFHNELYGFVKSKYQKNGSLLSFDKFLINEGDKKKTWTYNNLKYKGLTTYIRNYIHHPEQDQNTKHSKKDLDWSIKFLIKLMRRP